MRTENTIRGFSSILLVFAIVLSMAISITLTAPPVAADAIIKVPGDSPIPNVYNINQGQTFLLRHRMAWDEPGVPGYYLVAIYWDYTDPFGVPDNAWHFTLVSATAYIDNNFDNVPDAGLILDNTVSTGDNGSRYTIGVSNAVGNDNDGIFNVDIVLRASGPDGTVHENTDNHPIFYTIVQSLESVPPSAAVPLVSVVISEWTSGVVVRGKANAYNVNGAGMPPYEDYTAGDLPPIVAAQRVDDGALLVGGFSSWSRNYRWNDVSPLNPDPHLDNLLDAAFQWMVPGATDVLWWEHPDVYNDTSQCSQLVDALTALGYTVVGDDRELADMYTGYIESYSGTINENLGDIDDSYAVENKPSQNDGGYGGSSYNLWVGTNTGDNEENCRPFYKFDLTGLSAPTSISSATLLVEASAYPTENITVGIYESGDDWNEDNLSWDNMPATGAFIDSVVFDTEIRYNYYAWDVTSYVQSEFAIDNVVSIMMKSENEDLLKGCRLAAKESYSGSYTPRLEITYEGTIYEVYDYGLENMDILVINQLQKNYGARYAGGDPDELPASDVAIIESWVRGGGGLMISEGGDYGGHNYCRVQNKILAALDSNWYLQHDQVWDDTDNWGALYEIVADVDTGTPIGLYYETNTSGSPGKTTVGVYSAASLVAVPLSFSVDTAVGPAVVSQPESTTVTFNVTVTNLGDGDRFLLSVSDGLGWNPQISDSYVDLGVGESDATITASVDIPVATPYCTYDTISVTATSVTDNTVFDVGTAQAHSLGAPSILRGVTVDIHPEHQEAELVIDYDAVKKRYDPLTFKVIVTNTGQLWDKYILEATPIDSDKILEIWPTELFLQPGESDFAVLSVTVPENEIGSNLNTILVEAHGTFSTGTGEDMDNVDNYDTCTVHIAEAYCVRVDVWPFQVQSATPGSKVRWIARVKNLGNVPNIYMVEVTNIVMDANRVYDPALVIAEPYYIELPPCNWEQVIIDLDVPEGLEMSTRIYVTVNVYSLIYEGCEDVAEVEVHVVRGIPPIPQGVIKLEVETEIIAIQVWPTYWDFGVLDETETATSGVFTVRNIGNKAVDVTIAGNDAKSAPGELTTTWVLSDIGDIGLDRYTMDYDSTLLTKAGSLLVGGLPVSAEYNFDITITAPSSITVPSRMWTLVNLTASEA